MKALLLFCLSFAALLAPLPAPAEVDTTVLRTLKLEAKPLDTALSPDGLRIFVLVEGGSVQVYSSAGKLEDTFSLSGPADGILLSPKGDLLYADSRAAGTVEVIKLDFVQSIVYEGSPVKGPESAPVAIAIFNDFQ